VHLRGLKLREHSILVSDAGAHRVDYVHADDNTLCASQAAQKDTGCHHAEKRKSHIPAVANWASATWLAEIVRTKCEEGTVEQVRLRKVRQHD
jgi:hypothetical protein